MPLDDKICIQIVIVSRYWNPDWQKESVVLGFEPDLEVLQAAIEHGKALGHEVPDGYEPQMCVRDDGLMRMAFVGPDYTVLVPAASRKLAAEAQRQVGRLTFYFICSRPKLRAVKDRCEATTTHVRMTFEITSDDGSVDRVVQDQVRPEWLDAIDVTNGGKTFSLTKSDGQIIGNDVRLVAQSMLVPQPFQASAFDLKVHYIGRARGELARTCALDRLESHEKYQRVLEEVLEDEHRNRDVWLVLASGTTIHMNSGHEDRAFSRQALKEGDARARNALTESDRVDLTEAMLINYFKPHLNVQHVDGLDLKSKVLSRCRNAGLTGLTLVFESASLGGIAMYTDHVPPQLHHARGTCLS